MNGFHSSNKSLTEWLRLRRGAELDAGDFVAAFSEGRLGPHLLHLDLSECSNLDDAGVMAAARRCPNLGSLSLCWCWEVTDVGIWSIVNQCRLIIIFFAIKIQTHNSTWKLADIAHFSPLYHDPSVSLFLFSRIIFQYLPWI